MPAIDTLVFSGGGSKIFAYGGVIKALDELGQIDNLKLEEVSFLNKYNLSCIFFDLYDYRSILDVCTTEAICF